MILGRWAKHDSNPNFYVFNIPMNAVGTMLLRHLAQHTSSLQLRPP